MRLLLDTHALLWWLIDEDRFSREQLVRLERAETEGECLGLSSISLWEIAKLAELGKISLHSSVDLLLDQIERHHRIEVLPLTARIALESTRLGPAFPRDPSDQLIAATARVHGLSLLTADRRIRASGVVGVV